MELKNLLTEEFLLNGITPPNMDSVNGTLKVQLQDIELLSNMLNNITDREIEITSQDAWDSGGFLVQVL